MLTLLKCFFVFVTMNGLSLKLELLEQLVVKHCIGVENQTSTDSSPIEIP